MRLHVHVRSARGLAKMDIIGESDPYAIIQLGGCSSIFKTTVKANTLEPVWDEKFCFPIHNPAQQSLSILLRDQDVTRDEDMATVEIPVGSAAVGAIVEQSYELQPVKGVKMGGVLDVAFQITLPSSPPFAPQPSPPVPTSPANLQIWIDAASKLSSTPATGWYVVLTSARQTARTDYSTRPGPIWDEKFVLPVENVDNNILTVVLRLKQESSDDEISRCGLQTAMFPFGQETETDLVMTPAEDVNNGGEIRIRIKTAPLASPRSPPARAAGPKSPVGSLPFGAD
jgi:Ca2+-dependent lipid-binding protein